MDVSASVIAATGALAPIIPPSIIMVIIAVTSNLSIGAVFLGGIIPGLLIAVMVGIICWVYARRGGAAYIDAQPFSLPRLGRAFVSAVPGLVLPVIIVGGIVGGVFTATEASCIALVATLVISLYIYREIGIRDLPRLLLRSVSLSAAVLVIVATASIFSWIIASLGVTQALDSWMRAVTDSPLVFLLIVNLLLLFVGMFMESVSAILIVLPVLLPIARGYGIDPVQFGVMAGLNLSIGLITPPYGICLYVSSVVFERRVELVSRKIWIPLIPMLIVLALVAYAPPISLLLPNTFLP